MYAKQSSFIKHLPFKGSFRILHFAPKTNIFQRNRERKKKNKIVFVNRKRESQSHRSNKIEMNIFYFDLTCICFRIHKTYDETISILLFFFFN